MKRACNTRVVLVKVLFLAVVGLLSAESVAALAGLHVYRDPRIALAECVLALLLLLTHARAMLGVRRAVLFAMLAGGAGFVAEAVSLNWCTLFGAPYTYTMDEPMLAGVPLSVPVFWAVFIYGGYGISTSYLHWLGRGKPRIGRDSPLALLSLVCLDSIIVVSMDLLIDPVLVRFGRWVWLTDGAFHGVPLGNFAGWIVVAALASAAFRTVEYFRPREPARPCPAVFYLMPIGCYSALCALLEITAVRLSLPELALVGVMASAPFVAIHTLLFVQWCNRSDASDRDQALIAQGWCSPRTLLDWLKHQ